MDNKFYKAISRRRVSCPLITQQLWDAIKIICYQRQQPNLERISKYMSRVHNVAEEEVGRQLVHCERDGLLKQCKRLGQKGKMCGVEQQKYQIPTSLDPERDGHDWYCSECHDSGDVICCTSCHRVVHLACIPTSELPSDDVKHTFTCTVCKRCSEEQEVTPAGRKEINRLLVYTCARLKERLPSCLTNRQVPSHCSYMSGGGGASRGSGLTWVVQEEQLWRADFLLFHTMDLARMENKAKAKEYTSLAEFEADAATIVHNVVIYHGVNSSIADQARQMLRDCTYDLGEMRQCRDCYRRSNEKTSKNWFCEPCSPPHTLVYAKQKGYPFWPAKVIKTENGMYDVRFFGGPHERAKLEQSHIRPITTEVGELGVKQRTATWVKACEELRRHQQLLSSLAEGAPRPPSPSSSENEEVKQEVLDEESTPRKKQKRGGSSVKGRGKSVVREETEEETPATPAEQPAERKTPGSGRGRRKRAAAPESFGEDEEDSDNKTQTRRPRMKPGSRGRKKVKEEQSSHDEDDDEEEGSVSSTNHQHHLTKDVWEEDLVSSSCMEPRACSIGVQTPPRFSKAETKGKRHNKEAEKKELDKLRRELEREKAQALAQVIRNHERETERLRAEHAAELAQVNELHKQALAETKRKQWCYDCEAEAIYHCCWNTAYCSIECQQTHWHKEHKRLCRRKR